MKRTSWNLLIIILLVLMPAIGAQGITKTYTLDADFDLGKMVNIVHDPSDQLQLADAMSPFNFLWVPTFDRGTVVKIDTLTGEVLGEYYTSPKGRYREPRGTAVDRNGNVWVANEREPKYDTHIWGSVVHIGLKENGQCIDRNNNGVIDTSTGRGDIRAWNNNGYVDSRGGVTTAEDECIIHYTRVNGKQAQYLSVDANNDLWVGGWRNKYFDLVDSVTGEIILNGGSVGYGGSFGLIDPNGVIWSRSTSPSGFLRWDTALPLSDPNAWEATTGFPVGGLCIDSQGNIWVTESIGNAIRKYAPNGSLLGIFSHGYNTAKGCVVDGNDHVWVAQGWLDGPYYARVIPTTVGHLLNDGTYIGRVYVGPDSGPSGVAVDAAGKVWAVNFYSGTAARIDPTAGPLGADGTTSIGAVDFISPKLGNYIYNPTDMTGSTLSGAPNNGTWTIVYDSGTPGTRWGTVTWTSIEPYDSSIVVTASSSPDGVVFGPQEIVTRDIDFNVADGQYLKVSVNFSRATGGEESPILSDLTIYTDNGSPVSNPGFDRFVECQSIDSTTVTLDGSGSYDPDGDPLLYEWRKDGEVISIEPVFEIALSFDEHTFELTVDDGNGGVGIAELDITVIDKTLPVTTSTLSGTLGDNGWYVSDVDVELLATDTCSGVKEIHYIIEGPGYDNSEIIEPGDNVNFNLNADGTYTLTYWAVDNAGNIEVIAEKPINREVSPPSVTPVVPSIPSSGYYTSCVDVELQTTQSVSGGDITEYSLDGGQTWQAYNGSFAICSTTTVQYRSTSNAGNVSYNVIEINIDQTPPVITIKGAEDGGTYVLGVFEGPSYEVYDATSGIASSSDNLSGGDGYGLGVFNYSVTAEDNAGNVASASVTYEVIGSIEGLMALVEHYSTSGNIDRKTTKTLMNILRDALKAPNVNAQDGLLGDFIGLVSAQKDKKIIPEEIANVLINTATYIRNNN